MEFYQMEGMDYLIRKPSCFDEKRKYPVILLLHGSGSRGRDIQMLLKNPFFTITEKMDLPFVTVAPQCSEDSWFDMFERLKRLVRHIVSLDYVDAERLYMTGASMGGYGSWHLAMSMPEHFAAIAPICGGGTYANAGRLKNVPVWAFHGAKDRLVLPEESEKMCRCVNGCGGSAKLTVYPENGHDAWSDTYSNPELYEWFLSHRRAEASAPDLFVSDARKFG